MKTITDKLQRVLNATGRVVSDTRKFDRGLSAILHGELHWLDVPERITDKLAVMVYRCMHGQAPRHLADHLTPVSDVASRLRLRVANGQQLLVPRCRLDTYTAVGLSSLLVQRYGIRYLTNSETRRVVQTVLNSSSRQSCAVFTNVSSALEVSSNDMRYINSRFTYFTYLLL